MNRPLAPCWTALLALLMQGALADSVGEGDITHRADFEQHLDRGISAELRFRDEINQNVVLRDYFTGHPLILVFTYFACSNLCPTVIGNLRDRLATASLPGAALPQVLVVSVNPDDSPAEAAQKKLAYLVDPPATRNRWHFLTGKTADINQLAEDAGLRYAYDPSTHQYAHPAGIVLLTPQGTIAGYLFGFDFTSLQLSKALTAAAAHRIASPLERVLLVCFHYNPITGPYSATIFAALQGVSAATLLCLVAFVWVRRTRKRRAGSRAL